MPNKDFILDPSELDPDHVVADLDEIRKYNRQRFEMEQLTAVIYEDAERHVCAAYKDLTPDEFWVRGHMPGAPIMPGVVMCEAAAQLASYYNQRFSLMKADVVGFGGLKDVKFRGVVRPGDRFFIVLKLLKARRMIIMGQFQCFVRENLVCEGVVKGIPLPEEAIASIQG